MPFYRVHSGFGGDCGVHHRGRRHHFGPPFHHGPPPHRHHHQHYHGPPPLHPPPHHHHGPPPFVMAGGPPSPRFGRRGHRFMMKHNLHETKPDAEANSVDPAVDGSPFPPHHGPPPMGEAPTFGRRGRRGRRFQKAEAEAPNDAASDTIPPTVPFSKPHRRPHCRRGGPRGMCSDLPRESPVEVTRENKETKTTETPSGPPGVQCSFRHYPPRPHRHPHVSKKMMLLSLLEEQKRAMGELQQSKNQTDADSAPTNSTSIIQVPQQWHVEEADQSLILSVDVTGFKLEDLQLKVEHGLLSLQGQRTNSLGDVFELSRTKTIDSNLYDEAGIEARHDTEDESCSILRITIPRKADTPNSYGGSIPIQFVECINTEPSNESSTTTSTTSTVVEDHEKEVDTADFIPRAEFVSEQDNEEEEEEQLGQVETIQEEDSTVASLEAVQENDSHDSDTTQSSWEDDDLIVVDGPAE